MRLQKLLSKPSLKLIVLLGLLFTSVTDLVASQESAIQELAKEMKENGEIEALKTWAWRWSLGTCIKDECASLLVFFDKLERVAEAKKEANEDTLFSEDIKTLKNKLYRFKDYAGDNLAGEADVIDRFDHAQHRLFLLLEKVEGKS